MKKPVKLDVTVGNNLAERIKNARENRKNAPGTKKKHI
jgi:hypothetical protein